MISKAHEYYHLMSAKYDGKYSECLSEGVTSLLNYEYSDFKRNNGYKESIELSKKYHLYRQEYCGCEFSLKVKKEE